MAQGKPPSADPVEPMGEFRPLSEADVTGALATTNPQNPIACEVARLIGAYTSNFAAHVERLGYVPAAVLRGQPRWPIEAVAIRLTTETVRQTVADARKRPTTSDTPAGAVGAGRRPRPCRSGFTPTRRR